jgi:hypothetical protein
MLSSGRTVRWMLSGAGYLCRTAGYLYTRLGWFQPHVHASSLPLCHGPFCHSLHALYATCAGHVLPHLSARYAHPHSHPAAPPWFFLGAYRWLSLSTDGGPHPFRACKCVTVTCAHESILFPHLERQGGNRPSCAERCRAPSHKPRSSSGRGGTAPSESAPGATRPAQVPQLERPRRAYPPVSAPQVRHGTWYPSQHVLLPGASFWLRPRARRTAGARSHTHTLRHPWACQCGTPVHLFHARLYLP